MRSEDGRARLLGIREVQRNQGWEPLPDSQGSACWWDSQAGDALPCSSPRWVGLAIDGGWVGWRRGDFTVTTDVPGLHCIQLAGLRPSPGLILGLAPLAGSCCRGCAPAPPSPFGRRLCRL